MHELLVNRLFKPAQEKVWLGDHPAMTIAVDLGRKATKPTNNNQNPWEGLNIGPDLDPNYLQRFTTVDTNKQRVQQKQLFCMSTQHVQHSNRHGNESLISVFGVT